MNAKQKRAQKSRENNPLWPGNKAKRKVENTNEEVPTKKFKAQKTQKTERIEKTKTTDDSNKKSYAGMVAKPGENKLRTKFKLRTQAALHNETVKKEKKMKKSTKKLQEKRRNRNENKKEAKVSNLSNLLLYQLLALFFNNNVNLTFFYSRNRGQR